MSQTRPILLVKSCPCCSKVTTKTATTDWTQFFPAIQLAEKATDHDVIRRGNEACPDCMHVQVETK